MSYSDFYCNAATGSNLYAGSTTGAPLVTYTGGNWVNATRVFTVASGNPATDGVAVGDFVSVYADGASAPTGFVGRVTARTSTTITVSSTASSGTNPSDGTGNRTLVVGGVWAGPNGTSGFPANFVTSSLVNTGGDPVRVNYKNNSTYSVTAQVSAGSSQGNTTHQGYSSSPGDLGKAVLDGGTSGASYSILAISGSQQHWADWEFRNNGATGSTAGVSISIGAVVERCVFHDFRGAGVTTNSNPAMFECEFYACNANNSSGVGGFTMTGSAVCKLTRCVSHNNSGSNNCGFVLQSNTAGLVLNSCVADSNGLHGFLANAATAAYYSLLNCTAYNNGGDGFRCTVATSYYVLESCVFDSNTGYGVNQSSTATAFPQRVVNCGFYNNGSGQTSGVNASMVTGSVTFSSPPMVDPANGDFRPSSVQALGTGRGSFTQTSGYAAATTSYPDLGAVQTAGGQAAAAFVNAQSIGRRDYRRQVTRRVQSPIPGNTTTVTNHVPIRVDNPRARGRGPTVHRRAAPTLVPLPAAITTLYVPVPIPQRTRVVRVASRPPVTRPLPLVQLQTTNLPVPPRPRQVVRTVRTVRREPVVFVLPPPQTVIVSHPRVVR